MKGQFTPNYIVFSCEAIFYLKTSQPSVSQIAAYYRGDDVSVLIMLLKAKKKLNYPQISLSTVSKIEKIAQIKTVYGKVRNRYCISEIRC